jgi:hypothetical protein
VTPLVFWLVVYCVWQHILRSDTTPVERVLNAPDPEDNSSRAPWRDTRLEVTNPVNEEYAP